MAKLQQINENNELVSEYQSDKEAAEAVEKPKGTVNIMLCASRNHMLDVNKYKAYGFYWRFSRD